MKRYVRRFTAYCLIMTVMCAVMSYYKMTDSFADETQPPVQPQPFVIKNGDFEEQATTGKYPKNWSSAGINLLTDGGFETVNTWSPINPNAAFIVTDNAKKIEGYNSAKITFKENLVNATWVSMRSQTNIPVRPGATYRFSMYTIASGLQESDYAQLSFQVKDGSGNIIVADGTSACKTNENNSDVNMWKKVDATITMPANSATISMVEARAKGKYPAVVWFDSMSIEKLGGMEELLAKSGSKSLRVVGYNEGAGDEWYSDDIDVQSGISFIYKGFVKFTQSASNNGLAYMRVSFKDASGNILPENATQSNTIQQSIDWTGLKGEARVPANGVKARISLVVTGDATAYFDNINLVPQQAKTIKILPEGQSQVNLPDPASGTTAFFPLSAQVLNFSDENMAEEDIVWTLEYPAEGVSLQQTGKLSTNIVVASNAQANNVVTVKAVPSSNSGISAIKDVMVLAAPTPTPLVIPTVTPTPYVDQQVVATPTPTVAPVVETTPEPTATPVVQPTPTAAPISSPVDVQFYDLEAVPWAQEAIYSLAGSGVVKGKQPGMFAPDDNITRAEFIKILISGLGLANPSAQANFSDVRSGDWFFEAVATAQVLGISKGYPDGTFGVDKQITRQEMAVLADRAGKIAGIQLNPIVGPQVFTDDTEIEGYAKGAIVAMQQAGIIRGVEGGRFEPNSNSTRAQAAVVIFRITNR